MDAGRAAADQSRTRAYNLNEQGLNFYRVSNYGAAQTSFTEALAQSPNDAVIRRNLANAQAQQGEVAWNGSDYATAVRFWQQSLANMPADDPDVAVVRDDLALAQAKIAEAQHEQQDRVAAANMQQSINGLTQSFTAAPVSGGLEFSEGPPGTAPPAGKGGDGGGLGFMDATNDAPNDNASNGATASAGPDQKTTTGAFGDRVAKYDKPAVTPPTDGPDKKASDQLASAAAGANRGEDLAPHYDSGATRDGTLAFPPMAAGQTPGSAELWLHIPPGKARDDPQIQTNMAYYQNWTPGRSTPKGSSPPFRRRSRAATRIRSSPRKETS